MKAILFVVLVGPALGIAAFFLTERYHKRTAAAEIIPIELPEKVGEFDMTGVKERCFDASKEAILKELKAPESASFASNLSAVEFQQGDAESYRMASYVDARVESQDAPAAVVRMKWETLFDQDEKLVWMKIGDDEVEPLANVMRRLKGLPSQEDERALASEEAEIVRQASEERSAAELEELRNPEFREPFHIYAQQHVTTEMEQKKHRAIKHSKLSKRDDKYTACYWLGNDVWEASGLVESVPPGATGPAQQHWKVAMAVSKEKKPEILACLLGEEESVDPESFRIRAGVKPSLAK